MAKGGTNISHVPRVSTCRSGTFRGGGDAIPDPYNKDDNAWTTQFFRRLSGRQKNCVLVVEGGSEIHSEAEIELLAIG